MKPDQTEADTTIKARQSKLSREELPTSRPIFTSFLTSRIFLRWLGIAGLFSVSVFATLYWASGGFSFLSSSSDLAWLKAARIVMGELPEDQPQFMNLFTYVVAFTGRFIKDSFLALKVATFLFNLTLVGAVCFLATRLTRDLRVGVLSSLLLALHPSIISVLQMSAYQIVVGLAWVSITLYVLIVNFSGKRPFGLVLMTILSVLAAISDPLAGVIIVVMLFLRVLTKIKGNSLRHILVEPLAVLPGGIVGAVLIFFYRSSFTLSEMAIDPVIPALALLTAFFGGILLYRRRNMQSLKLLISWLVASLVVPPLLNVPVLTAVDVYALPSLLILGSALVLNVDRGVIITVKEAVVASNRRKKSEGSEKLLEVDITKLTCTILLILLGLHSMFSSYVAYAEMSTAYGLEGERYGDLELREAMTWINIHTPQNAVIVAENPLRDWVEAFGGRTTLSDSYVTDSILGANYEIRNSFLRLRDWGPVAPQRVPFFAVSDGESFVDFLYIDESHAQVTYNLDDNLYTPNFYNYTVHFSDWVDRSSKVAILRHTFEVEGAFINKTTWLPKGAEASIEYIIEAKPNAKLQKFSLKAWIPWKRQLGFTKISGSKVELSLDVGDFLVSFEGNLLSVEFEPDKKWSQMRAEAIFTPIGNRIYAKMTVKTLTAKPIGWNKDEVVAYATTELMAQHRVAYVVVPTIVKRQGMDRFGLDFPKFLSMFENSKLTVYKMIL